MGAAIEFKPFLPLVECVLKHEHQFGIAHLRTLLAWKQRIMHSLLPRGTVHFRPAAVNGPDLHGQLFAVLTY